MHHQRHSPASVLCQPQNVHILHSAPFCAPQALLDKYLISTRGPRATRQLWEHTAFSPGFHESVPTVVPRTGAITLTGSRTSQMVCEEVCLYTRTNKIKCDVKACVLLPTAHPRFCLGGMRPKIWTQQDHSFSSLVPLQLGYVPRQLGFGNFLFSPFILLAFLFLFLIKISKVRTAGRSENCSSLKSQLVMRKWSTGWTLFAIIPACPIPAKVQGFRLWYVLLRF